MLGSHPSSPSHLHNWAWSYEFDVAKIVKATSIDQISAIVRDVKTYPSPVRALGSIHSVTECVVSNGTIIDMRGKSVAHHIAGAGIVSSSRNLDPANQSLCLVVGLNHINGIHVDKSGHVVTAQAGVKLIDLHNWLGNRNLEVSVECLLMDPVDLLLSCCLLEWKPQLNKTATIQCRDR